MVKTAATAISHPAHQFARSSPAPEAVCVDACETTVPLVFNVVEFAVVAAASGLIAGMEVVIAPAVDVEILAVAVEIWKISVSDETADVVDCAAVVDPVTELLLPVLPVPSFEES